MARVDYHFTSGRPPCERDALRISHTNDSFIDEVTI